VAREYSGVLCIGDPHLASRVPGFRKDDYPRTVIDKLKWTLDYAATNGLLPVILGDFFHWPRDNANRLLVELLELLNGTILGIAGNHDCKENELGPDDALSVLWAAKRIQLLEHSGPWRGIMNSREVIIGGTAWGQRLPATFNDYDSSVERQTPLVIWVAHHDVSFPGYEDGGRFAPHEIRGVNILVNGHIHRTLADVEVGCTTWMNPGNIARVRRGDAERTRQPSVLRIEETRRSTVAAVRLSFP
jgi:predicted phosphodiesterase